MNPCAQAQMRYLRTKGRRSETTQFIKTGKAIFEVGSQSTLCEKFQNKRHTGKIKGTPESIASTYFSEEDIRALQHRARIATVVKVVVITLVTAIVLYITGIVVTDVLISSNEQDVITITELMN